MVSIVDVTSSFLSGARVGDVPWVKSLMSMTSISSLALTSKIFSVTFEWGKVPETKKTEKWVAIC